MEIWNEILGNQVLVCSVAGWTVAQVLKTIIDVVLNRSFNPERLFGSGGMPSSHSALITAMAASVGKYAGLDSVLFAIAATVAMVVMYDAANVRREAGRQAELLNKIVLDLYRDNHLDQEKLKELLGHTPVEVAAGMVLGIAVGVFV